MSQPATVDEARPPWWGGFAPHDGDERQGQLRKGIAVSCGSPLALSMAKMKRTVTTGVVGALLLVARTVVAEPGIDISTTPLPPERVPLEASPPKYRRTHPSIGSFPGGPSVSHDPVFIGPTVRSETTEFGFSAWTAPNTPVGSPQSGGREVTGWAAFGLTFTWGGPPHRPSPGSAVR